MKPVSRCRRFARALPLCLLCTLGFSSSSQPNQGAPAPRPERVRPSPDRLLSPPLHAGRQKICDLRHLALLIGERYARPGFPIATYEVHGFDRLGTPRGHRTFVVIAQGVTEQGFWNYWLPQIARNYPANGANPEGRSIGEVPATITGNSYEKAILDAAGTVDAGAPGANLILVGHSLGGIEHQRLVAVLKRRGFSVPYVVTFGSPIVARPDPGTLYRYVKADGDLVATADLFAASNASLIRIPGGSVDPFDLRNGSHHIYWKSAALAQLDIFGDRKTLSSPCLEIDLPTRREYGAPGLGAGVQPERSGTSGTAPR